MLQILLAPLTAALPLITIALMSFSLANYLPFIIGGLFAWLLVLTVLWIRLYLHYQAFTKDTQKKDLISSLNNLLKQTRDNQQGIENLKEDLQDLVEKNRLNFKKLGFLRFNPFTSTGGNQSFVLCLLDENDDGFVISSLHSRESTRIYAKRLENGQSPDQVLSDEEQKVIKQAKQQ